jgi:hypothetical protein
MLDFDLLRAFVAVAECGGFRRAAERLHLTQSRATWCWAMHAICSSWRKPLSATDLSPDWEGGLRSLTANSTPTETAQPCRGLSPGPYHLQKEATTKEAYRSALQVYFCQSGRAAIVKSFGRR